MNELQIVYDSIKEKFEPYKENLKYQFIKDETNGGSLIIEE
jgi:hypothetical protein